MTPAVIAFTRRGAALGRNLVQVLGGTLHVPARLAGELELPPYSSLEGWTEAHFRPGQALIFVGACGIAVRAVAPYVKDKLTDPAVVSVDERGQFVVPLLSGHVGGANGLAQQVARITGGVAAISTATDVNGLWAVDVWAREQGLVLTNRVLAKEISAALLEGEEIGLDSQLPLEGPLPKGLVWGRRRRNVSVALDGRRREDTLTLVPNVLVLGIGCRRDTPEQTIEEAVVRALQGLDRLALRAVASIDRKAEEPGLLAWCEHQGLPFSTFPAEELARLPGSFTPSDFVARTVGVDNVCERSVVALGAALIRPKFPWNGVTVAVGQLPCTLSF